MIPVIEKQREILKRADKALELVERKLRCLGDVPASKPLLSFKIGRQVEKHLEEFERSKEELQELWNEDIVRKDVVTTAENFHKK